MFRDQKKTISRNFRYPSAELREKVRAAVKERGFRSEQAFLSAACEHDIRQGPDTEATGQFEARGGHAYEPGEASPGTSDARARRPNQRVPEVRHRVCCGTAGRCATRGARSSQAAL